ncbi:MAG: exodeoxyribonuclease V subunit gamma [Brevinematales bacterium]|nr:exodeoxyribonuclease V subunit gamma [Brevinematales bacterium]
MIYFNFSNSLENILDNLYKKIKSERENFFQEFKVIISSSNYKKCIEEYFLLKENVCMNISFDFFEPYISKIFLELLGYEEKDTVILTLERNKIILISLIFSILKEESFRKKHKKIFEVLLYNENNKSYETTLLWKLSEKMADLLREYEFHRHEEIIQNWKEGKNAYDKSLEYIENFEKDLYSIIFIEKRFFQNTQKKYLSITELFEEVKSKEDKLNIENLKKIKNIFLFGFPQFSKLHLKMLEFLEKHIDIHLFSPNYLKFDYSKFPYHLTIEDNEEKFEKKEAHFDQIDEFLYPVIATNYLLKDKITKGNHSLSWQEIPPKNLLNRIKLLFMKRENPEEKIEIDDSFQIFSASSKENEVMTVYNSILYNMEMDKNLLFDDILVIVPDIKNYRTTITDIFSKNPYHSHPKINKKAKIPFHIYEKNIFKESNFNKMISDFFELIENNFSKLSLLKIIENPLLMKKFKIKENELIIIRKWLEELGAFDEDENFVISRITHSLKRLKFGIIMEKKSPEEEKFVYENILPYYDNHSNIKMIDTFISITERLYELVEISKEEKKLSEWINFIKSFINDFINSEEDNEENQIHIFYQRNLNLLLELDLIREEKLSFHEAKFHFLNLMIDLINQRNSNLFNGVCVSSFLPMRAIPFKIIYILGINEGVFPSQDDKSSLNLRNIKILYNDISKRRLDNFLFIEAIFSAQQKVYISFVGYDPHEDSELFPSSSLYNLINIINKNILKKNYEIKKLPKSLFSNLLLNKQDLFTNIYYTPYRKLSYQVGKEQVKSRNLSLPLNQKEINIKNIAEFINNPIQEMIKKKIEIYEPNIETEFETTRKIDSSLYLKVKILNMALKIFFKQNKDFKNSLESVYEYFYYAAKTPELTELRNIEIESIKFIEDILNQFPKSTYHEALIIGYEYGNSAKKVYKPLEINGYNIIGKLENVFLVEDEIMLIVFRRKNDNTIKTSKTYLHFKLFLSALTLLNEKISKGILNIVSIETKKHEKLSVNPLGKEDFEKIIEYYTQEENFHLLPLSLIEKNMNKDFLLDKILEIEKNEYTNLRLATPLTIQREYDDFIPENDLNKYINILLKVME